MAQRLRNFAEAEERLKVYWYQASAPHSHSLERIRHLMDFLGNPQDRRPVIHIAGTSGKTSTAYFSAAFLRASGQRVGLMVSPHVRALNERVQIDLEPLAEDVFCAELGLFLELIERSGLALSYPEVLYSFCYWECARQQVDVMVVEVGVGGLLDSTNVVSRPDKLCIITDIGMDHMKTLGTTLEEVTFQKAGIIGWQNSVFCYQQSDAVSNEIKAVAHQKQADLHALSQVPLHAGLQQLPLFQQRNSQLALEAVTFWLTRHAGSPLTDAQIAQAARVVIPGRMEMMQLDDKIIIFDGAHNPQKLAALTASVRARFGDEPVAVLAAFIFSTDRSAAELVAAVQPLAHYLLCTTFPTDSNWKPFRSTDELRDACQANAVSSYDVVANPGMAVRRLLEREERIIVVTGSLYMIDQAKQYFEA
jgi:dihydrofolate synthase/folylpolyglutamate synthase